EARLRPRNRAQMRPGANVARVEQRLQCLQVRRGLVHGRDLWSAWPPPLASASLRISCSDSVTKPYRHAGDGAVTPAPGACAQHPKIRGPGALPGPLTPNRLVGARIGLPR